MRATIRSDHTIEVTLPQPGLPAVESLRLTTQSDLDIPITITGIAPVAGEANRVLLTTAMPIDMRGSYQLSNLATGMAWQIAPSMLTVVLSVLLASALIQNFVFTRYLGLCVFFGVSRRRETAVGMGVTFTIVGTLSGLLAWVIDRYVMKPLTLDFLQIIVFIGIVACIVQMTDTIMRKINRPLHKKFGIYVVLITTNCIILAVPLLNALGESGFWESLALAFGSGLGFALALFLMSCARERSDLSPVPKIFQGLPIAFILTGLFALAFLGFSGMRV